MRDAEARLGAAVQDLENAVAGLRAVKASDGTDHVETVGVDRNHVREWKATLDGASADLEYWGRTWEKRSRGAARTTREEDWNAEYHDDPDEAVEVWDDQDNPEGATS